MSNEIVKVANDINDIEKQQKQENVVLKNQIVKSDELTANEKIKKTSSKKSVHHNKTTINPIIKDENIPQKDKEIESNTQQIDNKKTSKIKQDINNDEKLADKKVTAKKPKEPKKAIKKEGIINKNPIKEDVNDINIENKPIAPSITLSKGNAIDVEKNKVEDVKSIELKDKIVKEDIKISDRIDKNNQIDQKNLPSTTSNSKALNESKKDIIADRKVDAKVENNFKDVENINKDLEKINNDVKKIDNNEKHKNKKSTTSKS
ncbi:MAG: hypothetical protein RR307_03405, partial [Clostridia bacterium]